MKKVKEGCSKYQRWLESPIHPIFLNIRDKELQGEFEQKQRASSLHKLKIFTIFSSLYCLANLFKHRGKN